MEARVRELVGAHPGVRAVRLVGSRARGTATRLSDWDFAVDADDFAAVAADLPRLVRPLDPIVQLWDPLSRHRVCALMLAGPVKVDLLFAEPHRPEPPWAPDAGTLPAIDAHFWDWLLWLVGKAARGDDRLVREELAKMHRHLLGPLGVATVPAGLRTAAGDYLVARDRAADRFGVALDRRPQEQVLPLLG